MVKMITIKNSLQLATPLKFQGWQFETKFIIKLSLFDQVYIFMWKIFPLIYYNGIPCKII